MFPEVHWLVFVVDVAVLLIWSLMGMPVSAGR